MKEVYKKMSLFGSHIDDDNKVDEFDDFVLTQEEKTIDSFEYKVFDEYDILVGKWVSKEDCLSMLLSEYKKSNCRKIFIQIVYQEKAERKRLLKKTTTTALSKKPSFAKGNYHGSKTGVDADKTYYTSPYAYVPPKKSTGFLETLNKSDTFVIHCEDRTTEMLKQIYEGKNWDVLRDGNIDKDELQSLIESHDKIICLGHGTSFGLINRQGGGYTVGPTEAKYLKNKKLFIIWCNASDYAKTHGLHGFITGNMPSDKWEARAVGYDVEEKYMDDNITFWSKCCADYVDQALRGDFKGAAANIVKDYLAVYGDETKWNDQELGITKYNADRTTAV